MKIKDKTNIKYESDNLKKKDKTQVSTYTIYRRQYNKITELVDDGKFMSKSDVIRHALDCFFAVPYWEEKFKKDLEKEVRERMYGEFYKPRVVKVLDGE